MTAAADHALQSAKLRRPAILRYAAQVLFASGNSSQGPVPITSQRRNDMYVGRGKAYNSRIPSRKMSQYDVEVAMKYVLLGNLSPEWASKQSDRIGKAKAKLDNLGIKIESIHYTQGYYDFVDIIDAPNPEAMLAFSVWYSTQGLGRLQSMPAFDAKSFEAALKNAAA